MAQVLIRNIPDATLADLKRRAATNGVSLEQFLRETLEANRTPTKAELLQLSSRIRAQSKRGPPLSADERREGLA